MTFTRITIGSISKAKYKETQIMLKKWAQAALEHQADTGSLPSQLVHLVNDTGTTGWRGPYMKSKDLIDPWDLTYTYEVDHSTGTMMLCSLGSNRALGGKDMATDVTLLVKNAEMVYQYDRFCCLVNHPLKSN